MATTSSSSAARPDGRPLRCLLLLPETRDGGAESQARHLLAALAERPGVEPALVCFAEGARHAEFAQIGVPVAVVPRRRRFAVDLLPRALRLRRVFAANPPDVLHTWLLEANLVGLIAARAWPATRVVITQRGGRNELDYRLHLRLQRLLLGRADAAISNSADGAAVLEGLGMEHGRISVVPNGVPDAAAPDRAGARAALGLTDEDRALVWVSRIDDAHTARQKGLDILLDAVAAVREQDPRIVLLLAGPTAQELDAVAGSTPDWARPLGWVPQPAGVLAAADAVVVSSRAEGNSNVAGEALMLGRPVVSTATGEHQSVVAAAGGAIVAPDSADALSEGIRRILAAPPDPETVRAAARRALSVERLVDETLRVYG